jgi:hypothetical protein
MINQYGQLRKFTQRINSVLDQQKATKTSGRNTKGLLARQTYSEPKGDTGSNDYTKRIANYVSTIRKQRMSIAKQKPTAIEGTDE